MVLAGWGTGGLGDSLGDGVTFKLKCDACRDLDVLAPERDGVKDACEFIGHESCGRAHVLCRKCGERFEAYLVTKAR